MSTAHTVVTVLAAMMAGFSAAVAFFHVQWAEQALTEYGVPRPWWPWLSGAKAAGAAGLLAGLVFPALGVLAGAGLVLYFSGAVGTVVRARRYDHIPYPLVYAAPVVAALVLGAAA